VPRYTIHTRQAHRVTYTIFGESPLDAWDELLDQEDGIVGTFSDAHIELDGKPVDHVSSAPYRSRPAQPYRLERNNSIPLTFDGWKVGGADSRQTSGVSKAAWSEVTIYRTTTNKWVVVQARRTAKPADDRAIIRVCEQPADVIAALTAREGYLTKVGVAALTEAIDSDPDLEAAREERI